MAKSRAKQTEAQKLNENDPPSDNAKSKPLRGRNTKANQFLSTLANDPNDATTRLVYADWLEERGDLKVGALQRWIAARIAEGYDFDQDTVDQSDDFFEYIPGGDVLKHVYGFIDYIRDEGKIVFSLAWDSGGPGAGAGENEVYNWPFAAS